MGLAASQGRMLMITARKSDIELQVQYISQRRIRLSQATLKATQDYTAAISNTKMVVADNDGNDTVWKDLASNPELLDNYTIKEIIGEDENGNPIYGDEIKSDENGYISGYDEDGNPMYYNNDQVLEGLKTNWQILNGDDPVYFGADSGNVVREVLDESDDAKAEAEYETAMAKIQSQDKILELQLKNLETEHKALETEYDSVKKVIQKNIEVNFKAFS